MISAEVICDSISPTGIRLTTMKLKYPKFIHGEFMTHRMFSRNASSSRAIPTHRLIQEAQDEATRAAPIFWGKNQKGMQAAEELKGHDLQCAKRGWEDAAKVAVANAYYLNSVGAHKQIVNRILEPFLHITVLVTATDWNNFFGLRLDKMAQPEIQELAKQMHQAMRASKPDDCPYDRWHLPFCTLEHPECKEYDEAPVRQYSEENGIPVIEVAKRISVARCARVSYESFETGQRSSITDDLNLYDRLLGSQPIHASPAEHQASPDNWKAVENGIAWENPHLHGNFSGWIQYRKTLPNEECAPMPEGYHAV